MWTNPGPNPQRAFSLLGEIGMKVLSEGQRLTQLQVVKSSQVKSSQIKSSQVKSSPVVSLEEGDSEGGCG